MKKSGKQSLYAWTALAALLLVYNVVAFVIPFEHNLVFWLSYGFTMLAFALAAAAVWAVFIGGHDAKSRFYGFPIPRIGAIYALAQTAVGLVFMAVSRWVPGWVVLVVYVVGFSAAALGLVSASAVVEEISRQDAQLKKDVSVMRALQTKTSQLAALCRDGEAGAALKALAEELRYSDPVSADGLAGVEADLTAAVDELQAAVAEGDAASVCSLCRSASAVLAERNRLCKLGK